MPYNKLNASSPSIILVKLAQCFVFIYCNLKYKDNALIYSDGLDNQVFGNVLQSSMDL